MPYRSERSGPEMNNHQRLAGILLVAMIARCGTVLAETAQDFKDCSQREKPDLTISACQRVLKGRDVPSDLRSIAHNNIGNVWIRRGDYAKAIDECSAAVKQDAGAVAPYLCLGTAYRWRGEFDQALEALRAGLAKQPRSGHLRMARAIVLFEKHDYAAALVDANESVRLEPRLPDAHIARALILAKTDGLDAAIAAASDAIRANPKYTPSYVIRGEQWRLKGDLDRALADQDKAVELDPKDAENYIGRGTVERYMGELTKAQADFNKALALIPDHPSALTGLGLTFEKMGNVAEAKRQFQSAINSTSQIRTGFAKEAIETAKARLAAIDTGVPQPVIPAAPIAASSPYAVPAPAAKLPDIPDHVRARERRVALVIGNSAYRNVAELRNPKHDAEAIAGSLRAVGFDNVDLIVDATREQLVDALRKFGGEADTAAWAMIYYAGHGIEVNGSNYLIPIDARLATDRDVQLETVALDQAMTSMESATKLKLIVLDACRNNPFQAQMRRISVPTSVSASVPSSGDRSAGTRSIGRGLAEVKVSGATLVVYSAKHGELALDGEGENSPFAVAMVQRVATPGVEINKLFRLVRDDVMEATAGRQEPFTYGSLPAKEDFFFLKN